MAYQGSITLVDLSDGQSGSSGINTATIYLYKRAATVPNKPNGTLRYTFSTHTLSGDYFNEWESSIDNLSGNNPIWIIAATATASVDIDYDDILYTEWSNPIKMAENGQDGQPGQPGQPGQDGTPGINTATVYIYQRASSTPSTPANTSYTFATGSFIVPTNWYKEIPTTNGNPCYIASAVAISTEATATLEWSTPVILVEDGTDGQPGLPGEPGAQGASVATERELYYLKTNSIPVPQITEISQITSTDRQNGWTSISPTYVSGGSYYTCIETTLNNDGVTELIWSEPVLNQGLTVANANASLAISQADAVNTQLGGHFIYKGVQVSQTPAGAGVIQLTKNQQDQDVTGDPNQWGYNTWIGSNGIKLRLNQIDLSFWSNTGLTFYNPSMNSPNNKGIELNINGLSLYKPLAPGEQNQLTAAQLTANGLNFYGTSVSTPDVTLNADGLTLINGSIRGGIVGQDEFLYLSPQVFADEYEEYILSEDTEIDETKAYYIRSGEEGEYIYTEVSEPTGNPQENEYYEIAHAPGTIPIDNYVKNNWRQIIGRKFAVDTDGNLYANNANIEGAITATSLTIGSGSNAYDGAAAINISGYDIEIEKNGTDEVEGVSVYLYPILYHNGVQVPTVEVDYSHFIWYQDDDTIGTEGDGENSGRYLATYGHNYRVVYDFDDGAVGGGTEVQTRTVDPSKYITKINDTGITIHPEVWTNQSSYIQLDGTGMELFNNSGNSIAKYGSTARVGLNNSSRFLMNSDSLEAYDSNNVKYFEVTSSGLSWGNNVAATVADLANKASISAVEDAAKTATNYITTITGGGIKVHDEEDDDNYAKIDATGLEVFNDVDNISTSVAKFGATSRIGELASKTPHIEMNNRFMEINNNEKSYFGAGFVNQSASLIRIPFEVKYCTGTTTLTLTTNCTIASINEIRGYNMAAKVIPLVPNLNYVFVPGTNTITLLNLDNLFIESSYEFYIDYNTAQFSSLQGTYAPILNEFNTFFGDTYFPEYTITGLISARVDGDETPQLTYTLNQNGSITFDNIGTNDSHYIYISYVTSDTLFAVTSENQTGAIGVNSVSFGKGNSVSGGYSAAIGKGLTTIANSQMAIGKYNKCEPDSLFMVGNGDEPYNLELCLILSNASNHPVLKMDLSKVSDTIQGGSFYFTTSDQYKWFCEIPWYDPDNPIQDITNWAFRVDDSTIDFSTHEAVDNIDIIAIMLSQRMDEGEHNAATNTSTMIYATLAPLERNVFEVKTNGDVLIDEVNISTPEKITLTYYQCTTGSYTRCYRLGKIVILSFNINVTTSTSNYDYITGLPPALEGGWAGSSGMPAAGVIRWQITADGTLRSDGAPTTGWHNGNIVYICQ